ncbi:MAG: NADH-quinone oxidoreductase subunit C [Acidimicrobiales bacterium]
MSPDASVSTAAPPNPEAPPNPGAQAGPGAPANPEAPAGPAGGTSTDPALADLLSLPALAGVPHADVRGQLVVHPDRDDYVGVVRALRDDSFALCSDLCAVDYLEHLDRQLPEGIDPERFEVVVNLTSLTRFRRLRVRVQVPESDPRLPTLFGVYPGTEAMEREAYDMYGIAFDNHPDMTRILMPDDWEGHPLRKDYSVGRVPVQFKEAPGPR